MTSHLPTVVKLKKTNKSTIPECIKMKIQFSNHAIERMRSRNITIDQIKEEIKNPDQHFSN